MPVLIRVCGDASGLRSSLPQLVKLCSGMIEAGKAYVGANKLFVSGIRDLSQHCQKDEMISVRNLIRDLLGFGKVSTCCGISPDSPGVGGR